MTLWASCAIALGGLSYFNPLFSLVAGVFLIAGLVALLFPQTMLLLLLFGLPFFPATNIAAGVDLASTRIIILVLFLLWFVAGLVRKRVRFAVNSVTLFLVLFMIWCLFSMLYSPAEDRTLRKIMVFYSIFPLYFVVYGMLAQQGGKMLRSIIAAVSASGFLASIIGIAQFFAQFAIGGEAIIRVYSSYIAPIFWGTAVSEAVSENPSWYFDAGPIDLLRAFSFFPDPHMFSYFLAFALPLQIASSFIETNKTKKILYTIASAASIVAELLTFSRGGYVGLALAAIAVIILLFLRESRNGPAAIAKLLFGVTVAAFFVAAIPQNPIKERFSSTFNVYEGSNQGRIKIWREAVSVFVDHPIRGVGLGAYSFAIKPSADYREPIYAHNLYLELLAELGIPGLLFWLGIIFAAGIKFAKTFFSNAERQFRIISISLFASIVWFSGHSMFEMPIYSPVILPILATVLGIASYLGATKSPFRGAKTNKHSLRF